MATTGLIARLAHSHVSQYLFVLQAQLKLPHALDFARSSPDGSLLGLIMRLLSSSSVGGSTQWNDTHYLVAAHQSISSADFQSLRASLLSKLQSFVPGPDSDVSKTLHLWIGRQTAALHATVQPLADGIVTALLEKGADPLATDADGNNTLFHLAKARDYAQLSKLLSAAAPWKGCGVETGVLHHNGAGQTLRELIEASTAPDSRYTDVYVALGLIEELELFWAQRLKPKLIATLTDECGMAKDAAMLCVQYVDGSSGGVGGTKRKAGAIDDEEQKEGDMADAQ